MSPDEEPPGGELHPYPGLRPFTRAETRFFFGREQQVDELLIRLERSHFIAVTGPSGCGKSSLIYTGLIPALETGWMRQAGSRWQIATMRPGNEPAARLAAALAEPGALGEALSGLPEELRPVYAETEVRRGPRGLLDLVNEADLPKGTNLLILVDQFEELFRFEQDQGAADAFITALLEAQGAEGSPIYVVLTMRSEHLGSCTRYRGLPEALNESQYLVPRLTTRQLQDAITGPAEVCGAKVEPQVVSRLLSAVSRRSEDLPLLQHCLLRMWEHAAARERTVLTLDDYDAVGGLQGAVTRHGREVMDDVARAADDPGRVRDHIRRCFQALCTRGAVTDDGRTPRALSELTGIENADQDLVRAIVEAFRHPDCSFLTPPPDVPLTPDTQIDLTHERLITAWEDLDCWSLDEAQDATTYGRLCETAVAWQRGEADPLSEIGLQNFESWARRLPLTRLWARRHPGDYDLACQFLRESRKIEDARVKRQRANRIVLGAGVLVVLLALGYFLYRDVEKDREYLDQARAQRVEMLTFQTTERAVEETTRPLAALLAAETYARHRGASSRIAAAAVAEEQTQVEAMGSRSPFRRRVSRGDARGNNEPVTFATFAAADDAILASFGSDLLRIAHRGPLAAEELKTSPPAMRLDDSGGYVWLRSDDCGEDAYSTEDLARAEDMDDSTPHCGEITAIAGSPDGSRLVTGDEDGRLIIWDTPATGPGRVAGRTELEKRRPTILGFVGDDVVCVTERGRVWRWNGREKPETVKGLKQVVALAPRPDHDEFVAVGSQLYHVRRRQGNWEVVSESPLPSPLGLEATSDWWRANRYAKDPDTQKQIIKSGEVIREVDRLFLRAQRDAAAFRLKLLEVSHDKDLDLPVHARVSVIFREDGDRLAVVSGGDVHYGTFSSQGLELEESDETRDLSREGIPPAGLIGDDLHWIGWGRSTPGSRRDGGGEDGASEIVIVSRGRSGRMAWARGHALDFTIATQLRDVASPDVETRWGHAAPVSALAFVGDRVVSGDESGLVTFWGEDGSYQGSVGRRSRFGDRGVWLDDETLVHQSPTSDQEAVLTRVDVRAQSSHELGEGERERVLRMAAAGGTRTVAIAHPGNVDLWSLGPNGDLPAESSRFPTGTQDAIRRLSLSPSGSTLVAARKEPKAFLRWDAARPGSYPQWVRLYDLRDGLSPSVAVALAGDGSVLSRRGLFEKPGQPWLAGSEDFFAGEVTPPSWIKDLRSVPGEPQIYARGSNGIFSIAVAGGSEPRRVVDRLVDRLVDAFAVDPRAGWLAYGESRRERVATVRVKRLDGEGEGRSFELDDEPQALRFSSVDLSPGSAYVAAVTTRSKGAIWALGDELDCERIPVEGQRIRWVSDRKLLVLGYDGTLRSRELSSCALDADDEVLASDVRDFALNGDRTKLVYLEVKESEKDEGSSQVELCELDLDPIACEGVDVRKDARAVAIDGPGGEVAVIGPDWARLFQRASPGSGLLEATLPPIFERWPTLREVAFSHDGGILLVLGGGQPSDWELRKLSTQEAWRRVEPGETPLAVSSGGDRFLTLRETGVRLSGWEDPVSLPSGTEGEVTAAALGASQFVVGTSEGEVLVHANTASDSFRPLGSAFAEEGVVGLDLAGDLVAAVGASGSLAVSGLTTPSSPWEILPRDAELSERGGAVACALHPEEPLIAVADDRGRVSLVDLHGEADDELLVAEVDGRITRLRFSHHGTFLAAGMEDGRRFLYGIDYPSPLNGTSDVGISELKLNGMESGVVDIAFDGERMTSLGADGQVLEKTLDGKENIKEACDIVREASSATARDDAQKNLLKKDLQRYLLGERSCGLCPIGSDDASPMDAVALEEAGCLPAVVQEFREATSATAEPP